jgi:plasmid stabilization system protein ParE
VFYERQGAHVGEYFTDTLFSDIDSLTISGGVHREIYGYHRLLSKRFPFAVYYNVKDGTVFVYRVLDTRQDPDKTKGNLLGK